MNRRSTRVLGTLLLVLATVHWVAGRPALAVAETVISIQTAPATSNPGDTPEVRVDMSGSMGSVAGMQADISWDPNCLSMGSGDRNTAACYGNPQLPKNLSTSFKSGSTLRALLLSLSDVDPIAQDAWLFACQFTVVPTTTTSQCPISLSNVILSDSKGGRLPVQVISGVIQIDQPNTLPTPLGEGFRNAGAAASQTSSGCATQPVQSGARDLAWLLIVPAVAYRGRRQLR